MIATSSLERIASTIVALDRIRQRRLEPSLFIEQAFRTCGQLLELPASAYWIVDPAGNATLVGQSVVREGDITTAANAFTETLNRNLTPHLQKICNDGTLRIVPQELQSKLGLECHRSEDLADAVLVLLPLGIHTAEGNVGTTGKKIVKAVFSLWLSTEDGKLSPPIVRELEKLATFIEVGLSEAITRRQHSATLPKWTRIRPQEPQTLGASVPPVGVQQSVIPTANVPIPGVRVESLSTSGLPSRSKLWHLATAVHRNLELEPLAYDVVNELQCYFGQGRVGLSVIRGGRCRLLALSGVESFDSRSPIVLALNKFCQAIAPSGECWWLPEQHDELPSQLLELSNQYFDAAEICSLGLLPIYAPSVEAVESDDLAATLTDPQQKRGKLLAILSVEGLQREIEPADIQRAWSEAEPIVANSLHNAVTFSSIPLLNLWLAFGKLLSLFRGHRRGQAMAFSGGALVACLFLLFWPSTLRLTATGVVQPVHRARVYAEVPGTVADLFVADGAPVAAGTPLLQLNNPDVQMEFERIQGEYRQTSQALQSLQNQMNASLGADESTARTLRKERAGLEEKLNSLNRQLELQSLKRDKLKINSPQAGRVITWELPQRLEQRPIEPGVHLLTVADVDGPWELELQIPDKLSGRLRQAFDSCPRETPLEIEFVLASEPTQKRRARVRRLADSTSLDSQLGSTLRMYADVIPGEDGSPNWLLSAKPGTEVVAHIHAGRHSLGYSLFYEFIDWMNRCCFRYLG